MNILALCIGVLALIVSIVVAALPYALLTHRHAPPMRRSRAIDVPVLRNLMLA